MQLAAILQACSFASQTFVCFANYFLLQLSQRGNFITSQYLTMCEQNFTALIYKKPKKRTIDIYICIGIYSNCSPASAKVIFVYMFLMISRKVTFVTQKFANPNKSNTFHNYLLAPVISQLRTVQTQRIVISFSPSLIRIKVVICHTSFIGVCHHFDSFLLFYIM